MNKAFLNALEGMTEEQAKSRVTSYGYTARAAPADSAAVLVSSEKMVVLFVCKELEVQWAETAKLVSKSAPKRKVVKRLS